MLEQPRNILITGGTGSLGSALVARWYDHHNLTVLSRDPHKQERMRAEYPGARFVLADICDYETVKGACLGQDILVHSAALKVVSSGEANPTEYTRVNVQGSLTVARAWREVVGKHRALLINSDKSCAPIQAYGGTKLLSEHIFREFGYSSIRYGNVVSSNGSFLHVWKSRIESGLPIIARTPTPTRFALSLNQAVDLVEDALSQPPGIYIPHSLPAFSLDEVIEVFKSRYDCKVEYEALLKGEKQHEVLLAEGEGNERVSDKLARIVYAYEPEKWMGESRFNSKMAPRLGREEIEAWLS